MIKSIPLNKLMTALQLSAAAQQMHKTLTKACDFKEWGTSTVKISLTA